MAETKKTIFLEYNVNIKLKSIGFSLGKFLVIKCTVYALNQIKAFSMVKQISSVNKMEA